MEKSNRSAVGSDVRARRLELLEKLPASELLVHEIYRSVQGESTFAGVPCVFIRLAVCGSRCAWCDTPHAFFEGKALSEDAVVERVQTLAHTSKGTLVELTGGEPLLQPGAFPLMTRLCDLGFKVLLETNGAHDLSAVDSRVHIIMDLKCPDSGEHAHNRFENLSILKPNDQIKFVIASKRDFDWAASIIIKYRLDGAPSLLFSPVWAEMDPLELTKLLLETDLNVRLNLQLHKYIWPPTKRGV